MESVAYKCIDCGEEKASDQFYVTERAGRPSYRFKYCKACHCIRVKATYRKWPKEKYAAYCKNSQLKKKYGLTLADFRQMKESQNSKCAICGTDRPGGQGDFHVDHCHETGVVRGLLCHHCNLGIGHLKHDPSLMISAATYLERQKKSEAA